MAQFRVPIVFIIFNRPDTTARVFERIRQARPEKLFLVADGPRAGRPDEVNTCAAVRSIVTQVDWPCEVATNFSEINLGCKARISSGLDWTFEHVEEAIILEDDCLPAPSFFDFCEAMLERYRTTSQVMMIAGTNFLLDKPDVGVDYYFSNLVSIWGWATWRRAWKFRRYDITCIDEAMIAARFNNRRFSNHFIKVLKKALDGKLDTWDVQWCYTVIVNDGLCVTPVSNQIRNIGYSGTHTDGLSSPFFDMATYPLAMSLLTHPAAIRSDMELDAKAIDTIVHMNKMPLNICEALLFQVTKSVRNLLSRMCELLHLR